MTCGTTNSLKYQELEFKTGRGRKIAEKNNGQNFLNLMNTINVEIQKFNKPKYKKHEEI